MESLDAEKFGGYNVDFLLKLSDEHECPVCKMALREPILTLCGHRLCLSCSEEMRKKNNGVLLCPVDNTNLNSEKTFPDRAIERVILQLKVRCNNFSKNCQWTGELKAIDNHLTSCEYQEVRCPYIQCSTSLLRKELSDHIETQCIYRFVTCQHCNEKIHFCEKQIHVEICECQPLYCVNQCGMKMLRKEMSSHITDICTNTIIPCQYSNIGCNFKGMRKERHTHANSSAQDHLSMAISKVFALENKIMLIEKEMETKMTVLKNEIILVFELKNKNGEWTRQTRNRSFSGFLSTNTSDQVSSMTLNQKTDDCSEKELEESIDENPLHILRKQKETVNRAINSQLSEGDNWYLLDNRWYTQWIKYVDLEDPSALESSNPGPIDNSGIIDQKSGMLKEHLLKGNDYQIINEDGWIALKNCYELMPNQEPICRKVVQHGLYNKENKLEVYLIELQLCLFNDMDNIVLKSFSIVSTIADVLHEAKKLLHIPEETETRVWSKLMQNTYEILFRMESTLQDNTITSGQILVFELKNKNGEWTRQTRNRFLL